MQKSSLVLLAVLTAVPIGAGAAQNIYVYPAKGQSADRQQKDQFECYRWAKQQSGFDPSNPPALTASSPPQPSGSTGGTVARGAAVGALGGAVVGEIVSDDAGKGAAIGAVSGGLFSGMRRGRRQQQQEQAYSQQQAQHAAQINSRRASYNRAYAACLEGRGYNVR